MNKKQAVIIAGAAALLWYLWNRDDGTAQADGPGGLFDAVAGAVQGVWGNVAAAIGVASTAASVPASAGNVAEQLQDQLSNPADYGMGSDTGIGADGGEVYDCGPGEICIYIDSQVKP